MTQPYRSISLFALLAIGLWTCRQSDTIDPVAGKPLVGSWLLVETGYSPGAGYIIKRVSPNPPQIVNFTVQSTVSTINLSDPYRSARTYRIDSVKYGLNVGLELVLMDSTQKLIGVPLFMRIRNDTLLLSPPCFEGCHSAFVRLR